MPIDAPVVLAAKEQGIPMVGELELAWSLLQGEVLAISGTNGKTTTTTLLGKIFENAGRVTHVAGNIGYPLSAVAMKSKKDDVVVVEVSSFSWKASRPSIRMWPLCSISPRTISTAMAPWRRYIRLKQRIFENQTGRDYAVLNMDDPVLFKMAGKGQEPGGVFQPHAAGGKRRVCRRRQNRVAMERRATHDLRRGADSHSRTA